jgi:phosphomannomutase
MVKKFLKFRSELSIFRRVDDLGAITINDSYMDIHIDEVLDLPLVDAQMIINEI